MQSAYWEPARRLKMCWWMALLSLGGHTGMEKRQMVEIQKRNMFRHIQTKKCVYICKTSEMAERQLHFTRGISRTPANSKN